MEIFSNEMGSGEPLVVMHGLFGISDNWVSLGRKYAENFRVLLLDLPNHGRSAHFDSLDYPFFAAKVIHFLESKELSNVRLMGHSLGGKVAMQVACMRPDLVQKLIVADIAPKAYPVHHQTILTALNEVDTSQLQSRSDADAVLMKYRLDEATRQFLLKNLYWKSESRLDWRFNLEAISKHIVEVGAALDPTLRFEKDTLFIRGGARGYIQDEDFSDIRKHFPLAHLKTIEGAGHWLHAQSPVAYYDITMEFLV